MARDEYDELRRQFQRQFRKFPSASKVIVIVAACLGLAIALFGVATSFYTVEADEVGVVLRFGRYEETTQPGLHFKIPFAVDRVTPVKVNRVHKEEFGFRTLSPGQRTTYSTREYDDESLMLTADLGIADVEWIVQYKIRDPRKFLFNVKNLTANGQPSTLRDVSETAIRLEVGDSSIDEVITLRRQEIAQAARTRIQEILDRYDSGIEIGVVKLQDVNPPVKVRDSFNEVNRAIQEKQTSINEARRDWNKEIPTATGEAEQMVEAAEGYKTKRINEARGDVARFDLLLAEYEKAKDVTRSRLYIEALEDVIPQVSQIYVMDARGDNPLQVLDLKAAAGARSSREPGPEPGAKTTPAARPRERGGR